MSVLSLSCSVSLGGGLSDGSIILEYTVPNQQGYLRFLGCDNDSPTKAMFTIQIQNNQGTPVVDSAGVTTYTGSITINDMLADAPPSIINGLRVTQPLINGHRYDFILEVLNADFDVIPNGRSVVLPDLVPAAKPPVCSVLSVSASIGNNYNLTVDTGPYSGSPISSVTLNIYNSTQDILKIYDFNVITSALTSRIITLDLVSAGAGLILNNTYVITANTKNSKGLGPLSAPWQGTIVSAPAPTNLALSMSAAGVLTAQFAPGVASHLFTDLKIKYIIEAFWNDAQGLEKTYLIASANYLDLVRPFVLDSNGLPTTTRRTDGPYASSQTISSFNYSAAAVEGTGLKPNFSLRFKAKAITNNSLNSDSISWQISNVIPQLYLASTSLTNIKNKISLTATGIRSTSSSSNMLRLAYSRIGTLNEFQTLQAGAFNKVIFRGEYLQTGSVKTPIELVMNTSLANSQVSVDLLSDVFATTDKLYNLKMVCQQVSSSGALIAESAGLELDDMTPRFASLLLEKDEEMCVNGKAVVYFKMSTGNSNSVYASLTFKKPSAVNTSALSSALTLPTDASSEKGAGWFKLDLEFPTALLLEPGQQVQMFLTLSDRWGTSTDNDVPFYNSSYATITYNNQDYYKLVKQGDGLVDIVFDLEKNPTLPAKYANFIGLKNAEFAHFLENCRDNEVVFSLGSSGGIQVELLVDGAKDIALQNSSLPRPNSLLFRVTNANTSLVLVDTPALNAELDFVLSKQSPVPVKADYFWVKCVKASPSFYVAGPGSLSVSVSRTVNSQVFVSSNVLFYNIIDVATVVNVETRTYAFAMNVSMNGAASANINVIGIPVFSESATAMITQSSTVNASGYQVFHFAKACSAFVYAINTVSSASNSLMVAIAAAPATDAPTANLSLPIYGSAYVAAI